MPVSTETFLAQTEWNHIQKWDCCSHEKGCGNKNQADTDFVSPQRNMSLHTLKFIPHFQVDQQVSTSLQVFLQIVAENMNKNCIKVVGINNSYINSSVFDEIKKIGSYLYGIKVLYQEFNESDLNSSKSGVGTFLKNADVAIIRNLSTNENMCQLLHFAIQRNAFIVSEEDNLFGGRIRPKSLYHTVCAHSNAHSRLDLVRWRPSIEAVPTTAVTVPHHLDLSILSATRETLPSHHRLLIICPYPTPQTLKTLVQNWRKDVKRNNVYLLTVNKKEGNNFYVDDLPDIDLAFTVFNHGNLGGEYYVPAQNSARVRRNVTLQSTQLGDVRSLEWADVAEKCGSGIPVAVHYAGLTNTDYKKAIGVKPANHNENSYGMDFSGVTESGERVMGLVGGGAASSVVHARPELLWPVPAHWTLEDAATVPLAYVHALYCLGIKKPVTLTPETTVFVHRGDGAFGQAVISIALGHGCRVYTTVTHRRNKYFMSKLFPALQADHIGDIKDRNFVNTVLSDTKGNGCDIVLSCVKGDMRKSSILCCGLDAICLDFAQLHSTNKDNRGCAMFNFQKTRSYSEIDFTTKLANDNKEEMKMLQQMLCEGIQKGYVRPLTRVTYAPHDVPRAFRLLAASRQRGRVLIDMQHEALTAQPRLTCNPHQSQLIILSEERFGLDLVERLVTRGARKLLIHTKTLMSAEFQLKLRMLEKMAVEVQTSSIDLEQESDVVLLLNESVSMGPVQGIYVVTNDDNTIEEKVLTHLDAVSRRFCRDLRKFSLINIGETVYGKETFMAREQIKLPAQIVSLPRFNNDISVEETLIALEGALCSDHTVMVAQQAVSHSAELTDDKVLQLTGETLDKADKINKDIKSRATFFPFVDTDEQLTISDIEEEGDFQMYICRLRPCRSCSRQG